MPSLGGNELIIILVIVLVLFGGAKIPQMMKGVGEGMREFKKASKEVRDTTEDRIDDTNRTGV
jgi:sec-independent protein translocase protein TatA